MALPITRADADLQIAALHAAGVVGPNMIALIALIESQVPNPHLGLLPSYAYPAIRLADDLDLTRYIARVTATPPGSLVHPVIALAINSPTTVFRADGGVSKSMEEWVDTHKATRPEVMEFIMSGAQYVPDLSTALGRANHCALSHEASFIISKVVQKILAAECHSMRPQYTRPLAPKTPTNEDVLKWLNACMCRELLFPSDVMKLEKMGVAVCAIPKANPTKRPR